MSNESKIKVLVVPSDRTGVGKFRSVDPHTYLQKKYGDEFHVDIVYDPKLDLEFFKKYDMVHFHRTLSRDYVASEKFLYELKKIGLPTICDLDDYWLPGKEHPAYGMIVQRGLDKLIKNNLKAAQYVMTTTDLFADEIRKTVNENVFVVENGVDPEEPQFKGVTEPSDTLRVGWLGGSSHLHDLMLLEDTFPKLVSIKDQFRLFICGFDTRGTVTEINKQTGEETKRPIKPEETVWSKYEKIFTNNYKLISEQQKDFLVQWKREEYTAEKEPFYTRVWTEPVNKYAMNYTNFDVSLAPIKNTLFNRMKSQLKVIEAGFYKKAIIASNIGPYTIDLVHALDKGDFVSSGNGLLVDESKNKKDWARFIKKLIENPSWVEDLGESLYETVSKRYHLSVLTDKRREIYKQIT